MKKMSQTLCVLSAIALALAVGCDRDHPTDPSTSQAIPTMQADVVEGSCNYAEAIPSTGTVKLGIVRVNFNNLTLPANVTDAAIEAVLFTNASNVRDLYREMSYDQLDFTVNRPGIVGGSIP